MTPFTMTNQPDRWTDTCDVAFVVALREELDAADIFNNLETEPIRNDLALVVHRRTIATKSRQEIRVLTLLLDDQGPEHAAIETTKFLQRVNCRLLIVLGISGRISGDCKLGDVVLASTCDNSLYRAKKKDHKVLPGGKEWALDALAKPLAAAIENSPPFYTYEGLTAEQLATLRESGYVRQLPKTLCGPICTTPYLVDDPEFAEWLKTSRNRNILATDMESAAVVQAAHACGVRNGRVLVIRGVSDPADGKKAEVDFLGSGILRRIAIRNAAQLASHCVSNLLRFAGTQVDLKNSELDRPLVEAKLVAYKDTLQLLGQIASRVSDRSADIEVCKWALAERKSAELITQIRTLAQSSYKQDIRKELDEFSPVLQTIDPIGRDYLVASWIMDCLTATKGAPDVLFEILSNVYPQRVNRFCKAMLAIYPDEKRVVDTLLAIYETRPHRKDKRTTQTQERAKAHICYLLGRLQSAQQRKRAAEVLLRWRSAIGGRSLKGDSHVVRTAYPLDRMFSTVDSPEERLLLRTICISLILLEQPGESEIYVHACLRNKEFDSLNRGFHLEYYGDIDYDPRESMNNADNYGPCTKTFAILVDKLSVSYRDDRPYALRAVDLQTLLSLVQHRFALGALSEEHRESLLALLKKYRDSYLTSITLQQSYCTMMREHLAISAFKRVQLVQKLYELKKLPRTGWNDCDEEHKRGTPNPESILSHTAGGLLLIYFLLPERLSKSDRNAVGEEVARAYSKEAIISMFLAHDLAEAYTGDLTPKQRNDVNKGSEKRVNSILDLYGTYPDFHHIGLYRSWNDFENALSINGKVAREIDALDNLLQLIIENRRSDVSISDLEDWKNELARKIETPMGKRILKMIVE